MSSLIFLYRIKQIFKNALCYNVKWCFTGLNVSRRYFKIFSFIFYSYEGLLFQEIVWMVCQPLFSVKKTSHTCICHLLFFSSVNVSLSSAQCHFILSEKIWPIILLSAQCLFLLFVNNIPLICRLLSCIPYCLWKLFHLSSAQQQSLLSMDNISFSRLLNAIYFLINLSSAYWM